jgi:hypothetical protein
VIAYSGDRSESDIIKFVKTSHAHAASHEEL